MSKLSFWFAFVGFVYALLLLGSPFLHFPPVWTFADHPVILGVLVPLWAGAMLLFAKQSGAKMGWVTVLALPVWIGMVNWVYIWLLLELAAGC